MPGHCLEPEDLLALALDRMAPAEAAAARRHQSECVRCGTEVERLRIAVRAAPGLVDEPPDGPCLGPDVIAALADGALSGEPLQAALSHVARCSGCRREVAALSRLLDEPDVRGEVARVEVQGSPHRRRRIVVGALGLTAAAVLAVSVVSRRDVPVPAAHRDTDSAAGSRVTIVTPQGQVAAVTAFAWIPVPDADRYEVLLFEAGGTVVWEATTTEPQLVPPDSVRLEPGRSYYWRVRARVGHDQWAESPLHHFSVKAP